MRPCQVEAWLHEAEEHQYAPAACAHFHTNMKEVLRLLKSLRRTEQLKKTEQLNAWVDELEKACAKLDKQTDRDKLKLQKLLRDGSYGEAARMLNKAGNTCFLPQLIVWPCQGLCGAVRDEFNECVEEAVRNSFGVLKLDLEDSWEIAACRAEVLMRCFWLDARVACAMSLNLSFDCIRRLFREGRFVNQSEPACIRSKLH